MGLRAGSEHERKWVPRRSEKVWAWRRMTQVRGPGDRNHRGASWWRPAPGTRGADGGRLATFSETRKLGSECGWVGSGRIGNLNPDPKEDKY